MLTPASARTLVNLILNIVIVSLAFAGIFLVWAAFKDGLTLTNVQAVDIRLVIGSDAYEIVQTSARPTESSAAGRWGLAALVLGVVSAALLLWLRLKRLLNRLVDDPFHLQNSRDFRFAAGVALVWQALVVVFTTWSLMFGKQADAAQRLTESLETVPNVVVSLKYPGVRFGTLSLLGYDFTALLVAASLAILAAVFKRGHDLREEERRLRHSEGELRREQELTV